MSAAKRRVDQFPIIVKEKQRAADEAVSRNGVGINGRV